MLSYIIFYLDPGTAMIILQLIVSVFAGIAIFFKKLRKKFISFFKNLKNRFKKS